MLRNLFLFFQTILGYKQASSDGIDSDTIAFCKEDRSIHTHDTDFYCGSQKLGTAAYQSTDAFSAAGHTHEYLPLSGGTMNAPINSSVKTNTHIAGNQGRAIINSLTSAGSYVMLAKMNSTNGFFMHGTLGTDYRLQYTAASVVSEGKNYVSYTAKLLDEGGNTSFPGTVTAPTFSGKLNGNANTASKWAKTRTITIGNTGKSVNGSSNVSWSLSEIGGAPANHTHEYLPLSGGTVNGDTTIAGTLSNGDGMSTDGSLRVGGSSSFVGTATFDSNAVMNAPINSSVNTHTHIAGNQGSTIINSTAKPGSYVMLAKMNSTNGFFMHGTFGTDYRLQYTAASVVSEGKNQITHTAYLLKEDGNTHFPGTVTAPTFSGNLNGNADTSSKWQTSRTITIGNTSKSVDGSSNVSWSLSEIGAAPANHTHEYLPLSGNAATASKWNTARTITIGNTGKSVDGSSNVSWSLSEIGGAPANHTHEYLPLSGGTVNGDTTIAGTLSNGDGMSTDGSLRVGGSSSFVGTATFDSNAVMNAPINSSVNTSSYINGFTGGAIINSTVPGGAEQFVMLAKMNSTNGVFTHGVYGNEYQLLYAQKSLITDGYNRPPLYKVVLLNEDGNSLFPGTVTAPTFSGNLNGNADTSSKWQTSRTITIGNTGKSVDGSSNVSWSLSEIGAAPANHTHDYAPTNHTHDYAPANHTHEYLPLSGNAATASKWNTARTITIGNTGKSVDGSSNVAWSLSEIGAAPVNHTHEYLPLSGGTVNGDTTIAGTLSNGDGMSTDGSLRVGGSSSFEGTATFYITATFQGNAIINGILYTDHIKGYSENNTKLTLGTGNNSGYVYITDDMFGKNEDGGESWSINANSGYATFSGVSQSSDQRLKENIQDVSTEFLEKYWDTENGLIHEYDWKKSGKHATGMIAQELLNYIPEAVNYNVEADSYSVDYTSATCKIIGAMFKKIKELEETIHALEER